MRKFTISLMVLLLLSRMAIGQTVPVKGAVQNERGEPVPYANVQEVGTKNTVAANAQGGFTIAAKPGAKLLITASGYESRTVDADKAAAIALKSAAGQLSEVVVVAYGTQKRTAITGSVATVNGAEVEAKPFTSVDKTLQGLVAGLQSTSASGAPGSATDVRIRGVGSITAGSAPLYVIDGVTAVADNTTSIISNTFNVLSTLNPDDIESITVLKDAAAASIYGSRAANGVVLITTKKGKAGRSRLTFSTEVGQSSRAFRPKNRPLTTPEYQTLMRESIINAGYATDNAGADAIITDKNAGLGLNPDYININTDWVKEVTRTTPQQQYNLSLSGGNEKTQIYASGGFFKQTGITLFTDYKRYNGSLSVTHKPTDRSVFSAGLNVGYTNQHGTLNSGYWANPLYGAAFLLPWYSPRNADGSLKYGDPDNQFPPGGGSGGFNPVAIGEFHKDRNQQTTFRGYLAGEYQLLNGLKFTSRYSGEFFNIQEDQYRSPVYGDGINGGGGYVYGLYRRIFNWTWSNYFDYRKAIGKEGGVYADLKLGYEAQEVKNYVIGAGGVGFPQNGTLQYLASAATPTIAYNNALGQSTASIFSVGSLNYKDRYVLSGSFRRDASSVFGADSRSGNFYSAGATWNLNEEGFIRSVQGISLLKLRSSYGQNGNQSGIGYYTSQATFGYGISYLNGTGTVNNNYAGQLGSSLNNVGNNELTWERNAIFNAGLDFGLWKNRFFGTVEVYSRKTTGLLLNVPLSQTSGVSGQNRNVGAMTNKGVELTLGGKPVVSKDFLWTVTANFSHNANKITELYLGNPVPAGFFNYTVGHNIYEYYTRLWAGVDPANGNPLWYKDDGKAATTSDVTAAKLVLTGKSGLPKYFGSVTNTVSFKGLTLDAQFYYNFGNYIFVWSARDGNSDGAYYGGLGQLTEQLGRWQKPGDVTNTPRLVIGGNMNSNRSSTRFLYRGDYIRLRNLQLSYNLPATLLGKVHIANAGLYIRRTNLLTLATDNRLSVDPENGIDSFNNLDVFIPKTITVGIKIEL